MAKNTFVAEVAFNELWPYYQKHVNQITLSCALVFVRGYLRLIRKDSNAHMHGLTV